MVTEEEVVVFRPHPSSKGSRDPSYTTRDAHYNPHPCIDTHVYTYTNSSGTERNTNTYTDPYRNPRISNKNTEDTDNFTG